MMRRSSDQATGVRAAIVLAGGDGMRLRPLTRFITGKETPKQFCNVTGDCTLLEETIKRVAQFIPFERIFVVVNRGHRHFYEPLLRDFPRSQIVSQPSNRGTASGIYYGLTRVLRLGHDTRVTLFPSDHFIGDDARFNRQVESALDTVDEFPELSVILGMEPHRAETSYGWIEPSARISPATPGVFHVARFWEKPKLETAAKLWREGCLWNSFVIAARAAVLVSMISEYAPKLFSSFEMALPSQQSKGEEAAVEFPYENLQCVDFSESILSQCPPNLAVQRVDEVAWSDLGEPDRVLEALCLAGRRPAWAESFARAHGAEYISAS